MKVSVGNDTNNLTEYDKIQITDTTIINYPNRGDDLLQNWVWKCNDKNIIGRIQNFFKSIKTNSSAGYKGATSLPPIGISFMYFETSSNNHGNIVCVKFEGRDIIQFSNIPFYYNTFSILTNDSVKSMGRFRIQLLLEESTWSTRYNIPKKDRYIDSSTQWTELNLNFCCRKLRYKIKLRSSKYTSCLNVF